MPLTMGITSRPVSSVPWCAVTCDTAMTEPSLEGEPGEASKPHVNRPSTSDTATTTTDDSLVIGALSSLAPIGRPGDEAAIVEEIDPAVSGQHAPLHGTVDHGAHETNRIALTESELVGQSIETYEFAEAHSLCDI